jgi:hypothetical protein
LDSEKVSEFIGIVPKCSRRFRSGAIVGPLDGGLRGPKRECPGHLGQAHQAPKAQLASPGETLRDSSRRKGGNLPPTPPLWPPALGLGGGAKLGAQPPIYGMAGA